MKRRSIKAVPVIITLVVIALALLCHAPFTRNYLSRKHLGLIEYLEWKTYDFRLISALRHGSTTVSSNMFALLVDEPAIEILESGLWGLPVTYPFPRYVYGRAVRELKNEGAIAVGFDILLDQSRASDLFDDPHASTNSARNVIGSDAFFAQQVKAAGNVVLAVHTNELASIFPNPLFRANATLGDISAEHDSDGILRRIHPFADDPENGRRWHLGIVLAAKALHLDLDHAEIHTNESIMLRGPGGLKRSIPLDNEGNVLINWHIQLGQIPRAPLADAFILDILREESPAKVKAFIEGLQGEHDIYVHDDTPCKNKIVFIGSNAIGNNVSDRGATPLDKLDYLVSKHWNVANSILENQFIHQTPYWLDALIIASLAILSAAITWNLRVFNAVLLVLLSMVIYSGLAWFVFMRFNLWIPIALPVLASLFLTHISMVSYLVVAEQKERRHIRAVFSKIVAPEVVNTLLESETLALGGARRQITVFFADVRGFTEMTDTVQARAEDYVRDAKLSPEQAETFFDMAASETLETVNLYLGAIADTVKKHAGTLDKYIGDCVMAFWGAPVPNEQHALSCVRAAIDAQRALYALNQLRVVENKRRESENAARAGTAQPPLSLLPILSLGSGINTGTVIVGLMGSDAHILNYTVFGREVNLASRLESLSGRGRIIIGEATYRDLKRDDPALAATCVEQAPTMLKGFRTAVKNYEVPWKEAAPSSAVPQTQVAAA